MGRSLKMSTGNLGVRLMMDHAKKIDGKKDVIDYFYHKLQIEIFWES